MLKRVLLAAGLLVAGAAGAHAEFTSQRVDRAGQWSVAQWRDLAAPTRTRQCVFSNEAAPAALRLVIGYTQGINLNELQLITFRLTNSAWQIPEGTRSSVTIQSGPASRTFEFVRTGPTTMDAVPPRDAANDGILDSIGKGNPVNVVLPGNNRETIAGGNAELSPLVLACLITLLQFEPAASTNPFAPAAPQVSANPFGGGSAPAPNPRSRDPFATGR